MSEPDQRMNLRHIVERHAEDAAFLWLLRDAATHQPHYDLADLLELDERLEANLDGLSVAGNQAGVIARELLDFPEPGEVFINAWLAAQTWNGAVLANLLQHMNADDRNFRALVSALAWRGSDSGGALTDSLLNANDLDYYGLGIALCAVSRYDPGKYMARQFEVCDSPWPGQARALKACAELGRRDLIPQLRKLYHHSRTSCAFWSLWSGALLGDTSAVDPLRSYVLTPSEYSEEALALLLRLMPENKQAELLRYLAAAPDSERLAIKGAGWSGNLSWIPGLLARMDNVQLARASGEAFAMLTGADLKYLDLDRDQPEGFQAGPTDDPEDEDVSLDPDEDLPWPDRSSVERWWQANQARFQSGQTYLAGRPLTRDGCLEVLESGYQRQRRAAAFALCLKGDGLFPTSAPAKTQAALLSRLRAL